MIDIKYEFGLDLVKDMVKDKNLSRIYGFIVYRVEDYFVSNALSNKQFWDALDRISGNNWPIFVVRSLESKIKKESGNNMEGGPCISFLVMSEEEPKANFKVFRDFGLSEKDEFPLFVAFMWDNNDVLNQLRIPISDDNQESVYNSLMQIVKTITEVENKILPEYKQSESVFREVSNNLTMMKNRNTLLKYGKNALRIFEVFSFFL